MNQRDLLISEKKRQRDDIFSNGGAKIAVMRENARWYDSIPMGLPDTSFQRSCRGGNYF